MTTTIEHEGYKVTVQKANVLTGTRHSIMVAEGTRAETEDYAERLIRLFTYPACVAAVVAHEGFSEWPPSFEDFCQLDEVFIVEWEVAVYELNPHWAPTVPGTEEEEQEKNVPGEPDNLASTET